MRRYLADLVKTWQEADHDPSYLARGQQLARLEMWAATSDLTLTATETTYLQAAIGGRSRTEKPGTGAIGTRDGAPPARAEPLSFDECAISFERRAHRPGPRSRPARQQDSRSTAASTTDLERSRLRSQRPARLRGPSRRGRKRRLQLQDGQTVLSGAADRSLILWDVGTGDVLRRFAGHTDVVHGVAFLPPHSSVTTGTRAISASGDGSLDRVERGQRRHRAADSPATAAPCGTSPCILTGVSPSPHPPITRCACGMWTQARWYGNSPGTRGRSTASA